MKRKIDWLNHFLEFIVVVIGILLAFQLNSWSETKKEAKLIESHLANLKDESLFNLKSLTATIAQGDKEIIAIDSMLNLMRAGNNVRALNSMAFRLLYVTRGYVKKNAYQTLTTSGDIRFINDFELKDEIVNLYEYYEWMEAMQKVSVDYYGANYYPYLQQNMDMISGKLQDKEIYLDKQFKNIVSGYRFQAKMKVDKYKETKTKIEEFLAYMDWEEEMESDQENQQVKSSQ